jgi:parvulin-like peptidyl-prolyl isomerase
MRKIKIHLPRRFCFLVGALAIGSIGWFAYTRLLDRPAAAHGTPRSADEVARVGNVSITASELREALARLQASGDLESARDFALNDLIRRELLFAEAQRTGFTAREDVRIAWRSFVASRFQDEFERGRAEPPAITDDEVVAHFRAHVGDYSTAERRRLAIIFLSLPASATSERRARLADQAQSFREQAVAESGTSRDFGALAARHSLHQASRYDGGDVGWLTRAQAGRAWPGEVADAAFALNEAGAISPLLQTDEGWYLIKLIDRQPGQPIPLDAVRDRIRYQLGRAHSARDEARRFDELREAHPVQIFVENLEAVIPVTVPKGTPLAHQVTTPRTLELP